MTLSRPTYRALVWLCVAGLLSVAMSITARPAGAAQVSHEVARGESLWAIAKRYGVSVEAIQQKNGLRDSSRIEAGQTLVIPNTTSGRAAGKGDRSARSSSRPDNTVAKPAPSTQVQKSSRERGINPCNTPDSGFGIYRPWRRGLTMGQFIAPQRGGVTADGGFDVMFHFHGHEAVRKEWVEVMDGAVLVGVDLGNGSGPYEQTFNGTGAFKHLVAAVERAMAELSGRKKAHARRIGVSAWSAGYGAVGNILRGEFGKARVDTVVLLDGLHGGYVGERLNEKPLYPFIDFAKRASRGERLMFVSHSSIVPPGYASTTETANLLIQKVGGRARRTKPRAGDPMGLDLVQRFSRGNFHVRGFAGNAKLDHCAHIGLFRDVLHVHVKPRWNSPRGRRSVASAQPDSAPRVSAR